MRVVSYNILDGGEGRADPLAEVLIARRPDVVPNFLRTALPRSFWSPGVSSAFAGALWFDNKRIRCGTSGPS